MVSKPYFTAQRGVMSSAESSWSPATSSVPHGSIWLQEKSSLLWGWQNPVTGCPERLWSLFLSDIQNMPGHNPVQMALGEAALAGVWWSPESLSTPTSLWVCKLLHWSATRFTFPQKFLKLCHMGPEMVWPGKREISLTMPRASSADLQYYEVQLPSATIQSYMKCSSKDTQLQVLTEPFSSFPTQS